MSPSRPASSDPTAFGGPILAQQGRADQNYPNETQQHSLEGWRRLARAGDATIKTYDDVDHLFLRAGSSTTAGAPLDDLISWIWDRR